MRISSRECFFLTLIILLYLLLLTFWIVDLFLAQTSGLMSCRLNFFSITHYLNLSGGFNLLWLVILGSSFIILRRRIRERMKSQESSELQPKERRLLSGGLILAFFLGLTWILFGLFLLVHLDCSLEGADRWLINTAIGIECLNMVVNSILLKQVMP